MFAHVSNYELFLSVSEHLNLRQIFQLLGGGLCVQQVVAFFLVNLHVTNSHLIVRIGRRIDPFEHILQGSWNDASVIITGLPTRDGKRLARPSLAVRKEGPVVALECSVNDVDSQVLEDVFLFCIHVENALEVVKIIKVGVMGVTPVSQHASVNSHLNTVLIFIHL